MTRFGFRFVVSCSIINLWNWHGQLTDCDSSVIVEEWGVRQLSKLLNVDAEVFDQQLGIWKNWNGTAWLLGMLTVFLDAGFKAVEISNAAIASVKKAGIILTGEVTQDLHQLVIRLNILALDAGGSEGHLSGWNAVPDSLVEVLDDELLQIGEHGAERSLHVLF